MTPDATNQGAVAVPARFITNALGDIVEVDTAGERHEVNPSEWGWLNEGGKNDPAEHRRSIPSLRSIPGFTVTPVNVEAFVPGPKPRSSSGWLRWAPGTAPPAAVRSRAGTGTRAYFNRLSEAVGHVAQQLPLHPERSPMHIWDFLTGHRYEVTYTQPVRPSPGRGTVYLLDDGVGIKIGYTAGPVAKRVAELQTGNPRRIAVLAEIGDAPPQLERDLQATVDTLNISGEWYDRGRIVLAASEAGGLGHWLRSLIPQQAGNITVHAPYQ